jgi:phosphoserine phosphatase RsbU/P
MADPSDRQNPPRLMGYESWLYQMPCIGSTGDVFVSVPLSGHGDPPGEPANHWLIALGNIAGKGETTSRLKDAFETEVCRLASTTTDPASILQALNNDFLDPAVSEIFATLLVAVIDSDRDELTLANAGHLPPLFCRADRRVESLAVEICGYPLWVVPGQTYENVRVPIGPGEVVVFHSDGVTAVTDHQNCVFDLNRLRLAVAQAPDGAASVGQSILEAIRRFGLGKAQFDDITLLCLGRVVPEVTHERQG